MKKLLLITALLLTIFSFGQVPQGIPYQAIALNGSGNPVVSSNVRVRLSILNTTATGAVLYSETQLKTTNAQGLFNLVIGQGTLVSGAFNIINWGVNSKFLKVEMDATGGTTYVLVGTTQLLSVPYALAADSLVTSAGEGITLVSPNGTPYVLSVNDAGQLSLPTTGSTDSFPNQLFMYGSFNSFNASTSLLMNNDPNGFYGYKYLTAGTQLKYLAENNASSAVYGVNAQLDVVNGGSNYTIASNGFYFINVTHYSGSPMQLLIGQFAPSLIINCGQIVTSTYNTSNNTFSFIANGITTSNNQFLFSITSADGSSGSSCGNVGDLLNDGSIDFNGDYITFPNTTTTPKNYRVDLIINFNGSGTYTMTLLP